MPPMRLAEYLERTTESQAAFAQRAGLKQAAVSLICRGGGTTASTAVKIIAATGGLVKLEDLTPAKDAAPSESAA